MDSPLLPFKCVSFSMLATPNISSLTINFFSQGFGFCSFSIFFFHFCPLAVKSHLPETREAGGCRPPRRTKYIKIYSIYYKQIQIKKKQTRQPSSSEKTYHGVFSESYITGAWNCPVANPRSKVKTRRLTFFSTCNSKTSLHQCNGPNTGLNVPLLAENRKQPISGLGL